MSLIIWTGPTTYTQLRPLFKRPLESANVPHRFVVHPKPLKEIPPDSTILAMGKAPFEALQEVGVIPKNRTIHSTREKCFKFLDSNVLVTYAPGYKYVDPEKAPLIEWDIQLAIRVARTSTMDPAMPEYSWVKNFDDVVKYVESKYDMSGNPVPLSCDLETIGLDPFSKGNSSTPPARIVSISFTYMHGQADLFYLDDTGMPPAEVLEQIKWLCTTNKVKMAGANLKFDIVWMLEKWGFFLSNQKFDTFLVGSLLDENMRNSLNMHAKMYTSIGGYDDKLNHTYDKGRMDLIPKSDLLPYAGGDTDACFRVMDAQRAKLLENRKLANFYVKHVQRVSTAFARMEHRGVLVDVDQYTKIREEVAGKMIEAEKVALSMLPNTLQIKHRDDLRLSRPSITKDFLFSKYGLNLSPMQLTAKSGEPSTAMDHLKMFETHPEAGPYIKALSEWNSCKKTVSTYIDGFLKHLRDDGKFHPTYFLGRGDYGGTNTGRSSAKYPAIQTLPKHTFWAKLLRTVYVPPPGYSILKLDYSQGELRITACVANEPTMLQTYRDGIDLHLKTGAELNGYSLEEALKMLGSQDKEVVKTIKVIRQGGKVGNFGLIYGMGPKGLVEFARTAYGVNLTLGEATAFRAKFFNLYSHLESWHEKYRSIAHTHKQVVSPLGRIRHLPLIDSKVMKIRSQAERQAINSPIQGTLSDVCELAIALLSERYPDLWIFGFTHDELQCYVPTDEVEAWTSRIREVMENLPLHEFGWNPQIPFVVDAEWSDVNLASCKELKLAA